MTARTSANLLPSVNPTFNWVRLAQRARAREARPDVLWAPVWSRARRSPWKYSRPLGPAAATARTSAKPRTSCRVSTSGRRRRPQAHCWPVVPTARWTELCAPPPLSRTVASAGTFQSAGGNAADTTLPPHWWRLYNDRQLDALVLQALEHNTDLRQAVANLERDRALEAEVHGYKRPTVAVSGGPGVGHVSGLSLLQSDYEPPSRGTYSAGVSLSYQLDLFGQLRRAPRSGRGRHRRRAGGVGPCA